MNRVLVVCIGNPLVADDAAGWAVYELLKDRLPEGARICFLELGGLRLLDVLDGEDLLIAVDAVRLGYAPGTVHVLSWDEIQKAEGRPVTSHDIGLRETIQIGKTLLPERMPEKTVLVGIEGANFSDLGCSMTSEVEKAIEKAVERVLGLVRDRVDKKGSPRSAGAGKGQELSLRT